MLLAPGTAPAARFSPDSGTMFPPPPTRAGGEGGRGVGLAGAVEGMGTVAGVGAG